MTTNNQEGFLRLSVLAEVVNLTLADMDQGIPTNKMDRHFYQSYLDAAAKDLQFHILNLAKAAQLFDGSWQLSEYNTTDDLIFDAFATVTRTGRPSFNISLGILLSLDDFFMRMLSDKRFLLSTLDNQFNEDIPDIDCMWLGQFASNLPNIRYYDYRMYEQLELVIQLAVKGVDARAYFAAALFEVLPVNEPHKIDLALTLTQVALSWIILHEETHYLEGHLHFLREHHQLHKGLSEKGNHFEDQSLQQIARIMEWQADKYAAEGIIDVFLSVTNLLPPSLQHSEQAAVHQLRLILTAVGCTTVLFERARIIHGASAEYPSPRTRLMTVLRSCIRRVHHHPVFKTGMYTHEIVGKAYFHALFDVMSASLMTPPLETVKDKIDRMAQAPNALPLKNLEYLKDFDELLAVFQHSLNDDHPKDPAIVEQWFAELDLLIEANDEYFYPAMAPYREQAMRDFRNLAPL